MPNSLLHFIIRKGRYIIGKIDIALYKYLEQPDVCADFIQNFVFQKTENITEDMITIKDSKQAVYAKNKNNEIILKENFRDNHIVLCKDLLCLIIGIESQTSLSNNMPSRVMLYDGIGYEDQITHLRKLHASKQDLKGDDYLCGISPDDKLIPIITVVFYYGEVPWNRSTELFDMLDMSLVPEKIKPLLQNYKINLIDIHNIENFSTFSTTLGPLLELMKIRKSKTLLKNYINKHQDFLNSTTDELFNIIAMLLKAEWIIDKKHKNNLKGVEYTMCTGMKEWLDEIRSEGERDGEAHGEARGIIIGQNRGLDTACVIISELKKNTPITTIASKYDIDEKKILMLLHSMND